jgi:hypothetical protein
MSKAAATVMLLVQQKCSIGIEWHFLITFLRTSTVHDSQIGDLFNLSDGIVFDIPIRFSYTRMVRHSTISTHIRILLNTALEKRLKAFHMSINVELTVRR